MMIMPLPLVMVMTVSSAAGQTGGGALHEWPAGTTAKYEIFPGAKPPRRNPQP